MLGNHNYVKYSLFHRLLGYIWLLGTFVNSSCDIKLNIKSYFDMNNDNAIIYIIGGILSSKMKIIGLLIILR